MNIKKSSGYLFGVLSLIVLFCLSLWVARNYARVDDMTRVQSESGVFDLTNLDMDTGILRLEGDVSFIPGILTPEEYAVRENEAQTGNPWNIASATSRMRIQVTDQRTYMVTAASIDFAHRVYVNGELRFEAGKPAETAADFIPGHAQMAIEVVPENGVIELIQQGANFVHREGGGHANLYFGQPEHIRHFLALTFGLETIIVGLFAALFLVHLVLYVVRRSYKPNLIFSLLCLTWLSRSGVTGAKVFYAMFPSLPWHLAFRAEYLSLPLAAILMVLLIRVVFPGVPQKWFVQVMCGVSGLFCALCLVLDTVLLSWALMPFEVFFTLAIGYLCVRFVIKVPGLVRDGQFQIEQTVSLIGLGCFMVATINDALYHASIYYMLGFTSAFAMTELAMLVFSFFQMAAMFYGTMRETTLAHERERRAQAESEMLSEMNRLKSVFYTDMSHEMKTPLTVIAVNAQFAAQNIEAGAMDEETVTDLNAISAEARRLAQMVTSLVGIGRMQGPDGGRASLALDSLINETARIYQSLFARKNNTLIAEAEPNLPLVDGNADRLIQVFINLLSNANRHTSGGEVHMRAERMDSVPCSVHRTELRKGKKFPLFVMVSVTDNGEGIPPALLPHVFKRYCHGEKGGSGLGLSICKAIIEEHGGEMGIESEQGKGTSVWFTLPVKEDKAL